MSEMRAKLFVSNLEVTKNDAGETVQEQLQFSGVSKCGGYPADGSDEDNTFARWTPQADFKLTINNPALFDRFKLGQKFYVDFTTAE